MRFSAPCGKLISVVAAIVVLTITPGFAQGGGDDARTMAIAARKLSLQGQLAEAVALYQQALDQDPKLFDAQYGIGLALDLEGKYAEARPHLKEAIALASPGAEELALEAMGVSHAFQSDAAGAAPYYERLFDDQQKAGNLAGAAATANALGRVYLESGDPAHARTWYQRGYDTAMKQADMPARERTLWRMRLDHAKGRIAARAGDAAAAQQDVASVAAIAHAPGFADQLADYEYLVGYVALYTGHPADAIPALKQANQKDAFVLSLLAQADERTGRTAAAQQIWRQVLTLNSHDIQNAFARPLARKHLKP